MATPLHLLTPMKRSEINNGTNTCVGKEEKVKRSSKSKRYVSIVGLLLAFCFSVFMFTGCSRNSVTPEDQNPVDEKINYLYETGEADKNYASPGLFEFLEATVSETIGFLGGTIDVDLGESSSSFVVPVGALLRAVNISLEVTEFSTPLGPIYIYDCGPDGTKFRTPAKLSQPMPAGQQHAFLYYFNESKGVWELQQTVKVKNGVATFDIYHFSKYGIS